MCKILKYLMSCGLIFYTLLLPNAGFALSEGDLEKIEREFIVRINQSSQIIRSPLIVEYINHLGRQLAKNTKLTHYYFFIVKSDEINAFAGPGGYIGLNTQLILASSNESELAAVMSHELAHVGLAHLKQMLEHQKQMTIPMIASTLASIALGIINPAVGQGALMASLSGYAQDTINFTRANEKQADRIGINLLHEAGLNPMGMVDFFKKLQLNDRYYYLDNIPAILRTHPVDEDRISEALNRIEQIKYRKYIPNPLYFLFKEKIRVESTRNKMDLLNYYRHKNIRQQHIQYGLGLTYLSLSNYSKALSLFNQLNRSHPDNLFFQIPLAQTEIGLKRYRQANQRLKDLFLNYPDNYAVILAYADGLAASNKMRAAIKLLNKARQLFPEDITLCYKLSRAYAAYHQKAHAYFYHAQCRLLEGAKHAALHQLQLAEKYASKDKLLTLQIQAKRKTINRY